MMIRQFSSRRADVALCVGLVALTLAEVVITWPRGWDLHDFGAFLGVGQALRAGINPYSVLPATPRAPVDGLLVPWPNANPPTLFPLLDLVSPLDPLPAMRAWYVISLGLYALFLVLLLRAFPTKRTLLGVAWLVALVPFWENESRGQIYLPLAFATLGAWLALRAGRARSAGVLIGILTALKPNLAVWPAFLLLGGYVAPALIASGVALALEAIPLVIYGPIVYAQWLAAITTDYGADMRNVGSVFSLGAILGHRDLTMALGVGLALALVASQAYVAWRGGSDTLDLSARALVVALLAGPITWHGYFLLALPVLLARRWSSTTLGAAVLAMLPLSILPALLALGAEVLVPASVVEWSERWTFRGGLDGALGVSAGDQ
jgi:hypothetical protein